MFQITLDVFSGRPNPSAFIDGQEARDLAAELSRNRSSWTEVGAGYQGLGFRGVIVEPTNDTVAHSYDLPPRFKVAGGSSANETKAQELAERLVRSVTKSGSRDAIALASEFEKAVLGMLGARQPSEFDSVPDSKAAASPPATAAGEEAMAAAVCYIELGAFNPGFWNDPSHINVNNCYNYASNKRTNTFAQPGRGSGHMYTALTCPAVTAAAISDGLHHRYNCFPDSEKPRWLVAMVVAPGYDYHWYRKQKEGFWGHKPGHTAARNTDNNGHVVNSPETCARAPYTDFCGYFYVPASQKIQ
jgi:hypothetical protein